MTCRDTGATKAGRRARRKQQIPAFGKRHAYGGQASYRLVRDADEFGMTGAGGSGKSKEPAGPLDCARDRRRRYQGKETADPLYPLVRDADAFGMTNGARKGEARGEEIRGGKKRRERFLGCAWNDSRKNSSHRKHLCFIW